MQTEKNLTSVFMDALRKAKEGLKGDLVSKEDLATPLPLRSSKDTQNMTIKENLNSEESLNSARSITNFRLSKTTLHKKSNQVAPLDQDLEIAPMKGIPLNASTGEDEKLASNSQIANDHPPQNFLSTEDPEKLDRPHLTTNPLKPSQNNFTSNSKFSQNPKNSGHPHLNYTHFPHHSNPCHNINKFARINKSKNYTNLNELKPGDYFGILSCLYPIPITATVHSISPLICARMRKDKFLQFLDSHK